MSLNVRNYNNKDKLLFPAAIGDYLSKDHLAWVIDNVVEQLDLSCLYKKVPSVGNPSYHPKMMLKILFYGYAVSTFSSRKIAKGTETDVAFIFLSGMQRPDFRTISDYEEPRPYRRGFLLQFKLRLTRILLALVFHIIPNHRFVDSYC